MTEFTHCANKEIGKQDIGKTSTVEQEKPHLHTSNCLNLHKNQVSEKHTYYKTNHTVNTIAGEPSES